MSDARVTDAEGVDDEAYATIEREFAESELVFLTVAVASINAWKQDGDGGPIYASNITRVGCEVMGGGQKRVVFLTVTDIHFRSSPLMVQLLFFDGRA